MKIRSVRSSELRRNRHLSLVARDYVDPPRRRPSAGFVVAVAVLVAAFVLVGWLWLSTVAAN